MDKEDDKYNTENFERHPHKNQRDPEIIRQHKIIGTNVSKAKTSMVRKNINNETWIRKHVNWGILSLRLQEEYYQTVLNLERSGFRTAHFSKIGRVLTIFKFLNL